MSLRQFRLAGLLLCMVAALSLTGCGRRGPLETPSAAAERYPDLYPEAAKANQKTEQTSPIPSPLQKQTSYPLDPLL